MVVSVALIKGVCDMAINAELLRPHLKFWKEKLLQDPARAENDKAQRFERVAYYQAHTADKIRAMCKRKSSNT